MKKIYSLVSVLAVSTVSFMAQTNLVQNPSFEQDLTSWVKGLSSYTLPEISTTFYHSGTKSAGYNNTTSTTGFMQNVAIEAETEYTVSFWYKSSTSRPSGTNQNNIFRLWAVMKDSENNVLYPTETAQEDPLRTNNGYLPIANEWTQHTVVFTSHKDAVSIDVGFRTYGNGSSWVDDVVLVKGNLSTIDYSTQKKSLVKNTLVSDDLIFAKDADVKLINVNGQIVKSAKVVKDGILNVSSLSPGLYIVSGTVDGENVNQKIIKK